MLKTINGDPISRVPHGDEFEAVKRKLGPRRLAEVRDGLDSVISQLMPDQQTGHRTFSSSFLGSQLTPWPYPLAHLYDVAREIVGAAAEEQDVQDRAGLLFGLFIWESIMNRDEEWVFYDPNLSNRDPNHEITGKVYFERGD